MDHKNTLESFPAAVKRICTGYARHIHSREVYFSISLRACKFETAHIVPEHECRHMA